jgi:hypothetical protein
MAFAPLLQRPWGKKPRSITWKLIASVIWLAILCVLWVCGFLLLTLPEPGNRELAGAVGEILGGVCGVLSVFGLIVVFTRPKAQ